MGNSRKPKPDDDALAAPVRGLLRALLPQPARLAVAVSGGADSAMLAVTACRLMPELGIAPVLFHIHHGLYAQADDWAAHVGELGRLLGVAVAQARVTVEQDTGLGIEAAARQARYAAFTELARAHGVRHVLLAHHRDDQAETVLLRLLRGAGLQGMSGMRAGVERGGLIFLRPWLEVERALIRAAARAFSDATGWHPVEDPSNADPRYTRAAARTQLAPVLDARWPGWQAIVARHARHMAEAASVLDEVAEADLAALDPSADATGFSLAAWRGLSSARQAHVLRHWLTRHGLPMPSDARLTELLKQLRQLHALGRDRSLCWKHAGREVLCEQGRVVLR